MACCTALHATLSTVQVAPGFEIKSVTLVEWSVFVGEGTGMIDNEWQGGMDGGPPVVSFAERVLQKSLLSHAPPVLA